MPLNRLQIGIIIGLLGIAYFIKGTEGISCYQCNSAVDQNCDTLKLNDTSSKYYKPCEPYPDAVPGVSVQTSGEADKVLFCRKIYQQIKDMKDTIRVIRKCGWEKSPKGDCYKYEDDDHREIVCQCFTDGCNSAHSIVKLERPSMYFAIVSCVYIYVQRLYS